MKSKNIGIVIKQETDDDDVIRDEYKLSPENLLKAIEKCDTHYIQETPCFKEYIAWIEINGVSINTYMRAMKYNFEMTIESAKTMLSLIPINEEKTIETV